MRGFIRFLLILVVIVFCVSAFWWLVRGVPVEEQIEYVKSMISDNTEDTAVSHTADSASKLGKVLKDNFDQAQEVYEESVH